MRPQNPSEFWAGARAILPLAVGIAIYGLAFGLLAAQAGMDANIIWPTPRQREPVQRPIIDVIHSLLPLMDAGLGELGVDDAEDDFVLSRKRLQNEFCLVVQRRLRNDA